MVRGQPLVEQEFDRSDELVWLAQQCPQLASAGMLTLGYGPPRVLQAARAAAAAKASKRPFGLWWAMLPAAARCSFPTCCQRRTRRCASTRSAQAWLTTEDLDGLCKDIRDGGAALTLGQLGISEAVVWPQHGRLLEAWATRLREAREAFADDRRCTHWWNRPPTTTSPRWQIRRCGLRRPAASFPTRLGGRDRRARAVSRPAGGDADLP